MMDEEHFLQDIYDEYSCGTPAERWVSHQLDNEVIWAARGSTIKAKRVISNLIYAYINMERKDSTEIVIRTRIEALKEALNKIIKFQSQPYIKGGGTY